MLEFLMLGPKEIDGSGRVQIQTMRLHTMRPNPNNRVSLTGFWLNALNLDRFALRANLYRVDLNALNIDHSALKCNLYSTRLNVLTPTEI